MSDDTANRSEGLSAGRDSIDRVRAAGEAVLAFPVTRWRRSIRSVCPVFEGAAVAVGSPVVSAGLTVGIDGGPIFYTLTAFVIASIYLKHRL